MKDRKRVIKIIMCIGGGGILCLLLCLFVCTYGRGVVTSSAARESMSRLILGVPDAVRDVDSADIIRDYIYAEMEWPFADEFINDAPELIFESDQPWADKIYELCSDDTIESPGYCGGVAYVLATVYNMLGYKACTLDMAVFDEADNIVNSHVVTLVYLDRKWIVEDATFNLTYLREGEHLSIQELVESVRTNNTDDIEIVRGDHQWRPGMFAEPVYEGEGTYEIKTPQGFMEMNGGGYLNYVNMDMGTYISAYGLESYFEEAGYKDSMLAIYDYPYQIYLTKNSLIGILEMEILFREIKGE